MRCPLKCDKHIQRRTLEEHKSSECVKRPFTCKYCEYKATYELVTNEHWLKCQKYPEKCPNKCSEDNIERQFLQRHLDEECPLQEVECKFSYAGCPAKMKRREIQKHMDESKDEHLENAGNYRKKMDLQIQEQNLKLQALSVAITKGIASQPEFTVDNFAKRKAAYDTWYSPSFYSHIGGYKMCLNVDANGHGKDNGTHISVYVCMMKGEFDLHLQWPFKGEVKVHLVNQREGGWDLEKILVQKSSESMFKYSDAFSRVVLGVRSTSGWGHTDFISHADLYKPEEGKMYLKNDTLKFRVTKVVTSV